MTAEKFLFVITFGVGCFFGGMYVGMHTPEPKACPVVEGQRVVSTHSHSGGEYCVYARASGFATRSKKI
jgi:hypothetical protein